MLVKGIIEEKVDIYSYRVRIPFLNKVEGDSNPTLTEDLSVAAISTIPGIHSVFEQGDVVFIDFENDDFPVLYTFDDEIPVIIFEGKCKVNFAEIYKDIQFLYEKE